MAIGEWSLDIEVGSLPAMYDRFAENALLVDEIDIKSREGGLLFVCVHGPAQTSGDRPILVSAQTFDPWAGLRPGFLLAPETGRLFVGAGARLLCYDLTTPSRLWEDQADCGFWRWGRHGKLVWMAAELEFSVWSATGDKLWSTFVEPPWAYAFSAESVELDVMGQKRVHHMLSGQLVQ